MEKVETCGVFVSPYYIIMIGKHSPNTYIKHKHGVLVRGTLVTEELSSAFHKPVFIAASCRLATKPLLHSNSVQLLLRTKAGLL